MDMLRFAIFGAGFWARYQLHAWRELPGVECVAICDPRRDKAEAFASAFGIPGMYTDPDALYAGETLDFVDIITNPDTHAPLVRLAARHGVPVITQKPMATTLDEAADLVATCAAAGVPFFVHENWRFQRPMRELKRVLSAGTIGTPFRARLEMIAATAGGQSIFANQPYLKELDQFILMDVGVHVLDAVRCLFGEAESLYAHTDRIHADFAGEDVATVMMRMGGATTVTCSMGYADAPLERDYFPQTFAFIEGDRGSLELAPDYWMRVTTDAGTLSYRVPPHRYAWADPAYDIAHASIVDCNADLLAGIRGEHIAQTTGADNLKTLQLVFGAYESARTGQALQF